MMLVGLADPAAVDAAVAGVKAAHLAEAVTAGFPVPDGFVVPVGEVVDEVELSRAAGRLGERLAVRSSAVAEDLAGASFAGMYESYLHVPSREVPEAVRRCRAAVGGDRVAAYRPEADTGAMAVLVQVMVDAAAAGVAFTADPVTGQRDVTVVTAVRGVAEELVAGSDAGEEWRVLEGRASRVRSGGVLTDGQAAQVAEVAGRLAAVFGGPQDVEWAIDQAGRVQVLQARPMTALLDLQTWTPPGAGLWVCNFRLGEWLPDPVTPLFGDWLLRVFDRGFRAAMRETAGATVAFPYGLVNGWYYATPNPALTQIPGAVLRSGGRLLRFMLATVVLPGRDPVRADRPLRTLYADWRDRLLPDYRQLAATDPDGLDLKQLCALVEQLMETAGRHFWYLAVVGGSAWKMEQPLQRFLDRHSLSEVDPVLLLTGPDAPPSPGPHAVHSLDWFHPIAGEYPPQPAVPGSWPTTGHREPLRQRCVDHLAGQPEALRTWTALLAVARRYAQIRTEQTDALTLGWPLLRRCADRIGTALTEAGVLDEPGQLFFLTETELRARRPASASAQARRVVWQRQRRLSPPLTIGRPPTLIGHRLAGTVSGGPTRASTGAILVGQPASPGRATGPARVIRDPGDLDQVAKFQVGDVLVAPATTPAWTPLLRRAAAVVTDRGTAAAHAAIIAREYGIPAVVATGDGTQRLHDGLTITVDGSRGTVTPISVNPTVGPSTSTQ